MPSAGRCESSAAARRCRWGRSRCGSPTGGSLVHELVVLPLADGHQVGERAIGSDNKVAEAGSVGEASRTFGPGGGDGIDAGALGWVMLDLAPGRYELECNLAGHYAAGMYTELTVHAR